MIIFAVIMINILFLAVCGEELADMAGSLSWSHKYRNIDTRESILTSRIERFAKRYLMNKIDSMINAALNNQSDTIDSMIDQKIDAILAEKVIARIVALSTEPVKRATVDPIAKPVVVVTPINPVQPVASQPIVSQADSGRFPFTMSEHTDKVVTWVNPDSGRTVRAIVLGDSAKQGSVVVRRLSKTNAPFAMTFPKQLNMVTFEGQQEIPKSVAAPIKTDTPVLRRQIVQAATPTTTVEEIESDNSLGTIKTLHSLNRKFNIAWKKPDGTLLTNGVSTIIVRSTSEKFQTIISGTHPRLSLGFTPVVHS